MQIHFKIIGFLFIALAIIHAGFPKRFNWKLELQKLSLLNKQMMQVHTFFIALLILLMGILCLVSYNDLIETTLGKRILIGFGIFWGFRLLTQFFWYSPILWSGKGFETLMHILFGVFWAYVTIIFFYAAFT
ncbi:MAG: hypothetical protein KA319_02910 [Ferruginibacter sp.]|nr:hypothetical protein [Ferruginibacter sp.]